MRSRMKVNMKKKITLMFMVTITLVLSTLQVKADVRPSVSGVNELKVGASGNITFSVPSGYGFDITVSNNAADVISITHKDLKGNKIISPFDNSAVLSVKALKLGKAEITFTGKASKGAGEEVITTVKHVINVVAPQTTQPKPDPKPNPTPTPKPPVKDDTESEKDRIAREQEQKRIDEENKVKAEEERIIKEKEALAKVPLFNEISITSQSDKLKDEVIKSITIEEGVVEYEYSLPRKVNKVSIAIPETEGVTLTYDKEVSFGEGEESKVVSIKAVKEDIEQSYTIKINQDITPDVSKEVNGKNLIVHQDERVSEYFKTLGFETVLPEDATVGNVFENENVKFQLLVNENNEGKYYQLDEAYSIQGEVQLSLSAEEEVFFVKNLEDSDEKKLQNKKISKIAHDSAITLSDVDPLLKISNEILGWEIDEGIVFNGLNSNGQSDQFILSSDNSISKVVVVFDKPGNNQNLTIIILSVALVAVLSTQAVYFISGYIRKKKY